MGRLSVTPSPSVALHRVIVTHYDRHYTPVPVFVLGVVQLQAAAAAQYYWPGSSQISTVLGELLGAIDVAGCLPSCCSVSS
jgi:hypothetical protein